MIEIIPAILTNDPKELEEKLRVLETIKRAEGPELCRRVQIDIIDGVFADNHTVMPDVAGQIETSVLLDFHLMTKEPMDWVERCVQGNADRIVGHVEKMSSQVDFVGKVVEVGAKVGLALDETTPVSALDGTLLPNLDVVLVMAVKAGFGGQEFNPEVLDKIKVLDEARARDNTPFRICVDGGVNEENIKDVAKAGADEVAIGALRALDQLVKLVQ